MINYENVKKMYGQDPEQENIKIHPMELQSAFYRLDSNGNWNLRPVPIYQLIAEYLIDKCNIVIRKGTLKPYMLDTARNVYHPITPHEIREMITEDMGNASLVSEEDVIKSLKKVNVFKKPAYNKVLFKNGVLDMKTMQFQYKIDKPLLCLVEIPYKLRKDADPENRYCQSFLETSFQQETEKETREYILGVMEIVGYMLCSGNPLNKLAIGVGKRGGGKGVFAKILGRIFGENVAHVTLQDMANNRFATSSFVDASINIVNDAPKTFIGDVGNIKTISGDDDISIEAKGEPIRVLPSEEVPKTIMFCNELPRFVEDAALMSRFLIFEFKHGFRNTSEQIIDLADLIINDDEEMEWFINLAVSSYGHVFESGTFSLQLSDDETANLSSKHSDPLAWCISELVDGYEEPSLLEGRALYESTSPVIAEDFRKIVIVFAERQGINLPLRNGDINGKRFNPAIRRALNMEDNDYGTSTMRTDGEVFRVYKGLYTNEKFDDLWRELFFKDE